MTPQLRLRHVDPTLPPIHWRKRIRCVTFQFYTVVMGTGSLAFLLSEINSAYGGQWLITLADIVFIYNLVLFATITALIIARFIMYPRSMWNVLMHPQESSFVPCLPLAFGTLVSSSVSLGERDTGFWLHKANLVMWWMYITGALVLSWVIPLFQWARQRHPIAEFTPLWILPPLGITFNGAVSYLLIEKGLPSYTALWLLIATFVFAGYGCLVSLLYGTGWIIRLMAFGAPPPKASPLFCIFIGPIAWSAFGFIAMGYEAQRVFPTAVAGGPFLGFSQSGQIFAVASLVVGLPLWGLSWFLTATALLYFGVGIVKRDLSLSQGALSNWGFTFPLAAHVAVSFILGTFFQSRFLHDIAIVQTVVWILLWAFAHITTVYGLVQGEIAAEGKDCNVPFLGFTGDYEKIDEEGDTSDELEFTPPKASNGNAHV